MQTSCAQRCSQVSQERRQKVAIIQLCTHAAAALMCGVKAHLTGYFMFLCALVVGGTEFRHCKRSCRFLRAPGFSAPEKKKGFGGLRELKKSSSKVHNPPSACASTLLPGNQQDPSAARYDANHCKQTINCPGSHTPQSLNPQIC